MSEWTLLVSTYETSDIVVVSVVVIGGKAKKSLSSCGCIAANSPPEFLMCIWISPESVVGCSSVEAANPDAV